MTTGRINQVTIVRALGAHARQAHRRAIQPAGAISSPLGRPPRVTEAARRHPPRRPPGRLLRRLSGATSGSPLPPPKFPAPPSAAPLGGRGIGGTGRGTRDRGINHCGVHLGRVSPRCSERPRATEGQQPTEPIPRRKRSPGGPPALQGILRTACTLGSRCREGRQLVMTDR